MRKFLLFIGLSLMLALSSLGGSFAQSRDGRLPGTSIASLQLQKDTLLPVLASAAIALKTGRDCKHIAITNTELTAPPYHPVFNPVTKVILKGNWREQWTVRMCGKTAVVPITFIPDGRGGTSYSITPKNVRVIP
jgi:hypothetical protein